VYKPEVAVIESKPDNVHIDDLRLADPFPTLKEYAMSFKFDELDSAEHSHIPYSVILI
jgi:NEDD8-activating enzyme E1 regulatory subunit